MRTLQLLGFLTIVFAFIMGYFLLSPIEPDTAASAASSAGLGLMFIVVPAIALSALMLVPSSLALLWSNVRERSYFIGKFWLALWCVNSVLSVGYMISALYIVYLWFTVSTGN